MSEPTWQLLAAALTAITGILLITAAFSPENPAPFPAIMGSGGIMILLSFVFLRMHLRFMARRRGPGG